MCPRRAPPSSPLAVVRAAAAAAARGRSGGLEAAAEAAWSRPSLVPPGAGTRPLTARLARRAAAPPRPGTSQGSGAAGRAQAWP